MFFNYTPVYAAKLQQKQTQKKRKNIFFKIFCEKKKRKTKTDMKIKYKYLSFCLLSSQHKPKQEKNRTILHYVATIKNPILINIRSCLKFIYLVLLGCLRLFFRLILVT